MTHIPQKGLYSPFRFEPPCDNSRMGDSEVIQLGIVRISRGKVFTNNFRGGFPRYRTQ
jgi:hypothetical protein